MQMSDRRLEPIAPAQAVELYLDHRKPEVSKKTLQNQRYRLSNFLEWCQERDLENLNQLTGRNLHEFRTWRSQDVATITLVNELRTLQKFLEFCASIDAVEEGMRERVLIPSVEPEDEAKDVELEADRARAILNHLNKFSYASREHVIMAVFWHTGIRLGSLRAIDVDDYDPNGQCVDLRHRPKTDTPLKNKKAAERTIAISPTYCEMLDDYIEYHRVDVEDEFGRRPLITSDRGRLSPGATRVIVYRATQPCLVGECPHDMEVATCEYREYEKVSQCPSSVSPHAIRRGSITHHLREGAPQRIVEERSNVSGDVLDQHYDQRTDREKMEARRDWVERIGERDQSGGTK